MSSRPAPRGPRRAAALAAGVLVAAGVAAAAASGFLGPDPGASPTAAEVESRIMSPFCPGLTLSECPSTQSGELRRRVAEMTQAGWTNKRIDGWVRANYGEAAIARPAGKVVWLAPGVVLLGGALALALALGRRAPADPAAPPDVSPEDRRRIEEELRTFAAGSSE